MGTLFLTKESRIYSGAKASSSINGAGKTGQLHVKERNQNISKHHAKINSKWIKDLTVRPESTKLLEENVDNTLYDINHSKILYDPCYRVMEIKIKINEWDLIKLKSKGNYKQGGKKTLRMGESSSKCIHFYRLPLFMQFLEITE